MINVGQRVGEKSEESVKPLRLPPLSYPRTSKLVISHFSGKPGGSQPLTLLTRPTLTLVDVSRKKKWLSEDKVFRKGCKHEDRKTSAGQGYLSHSHERLTLISF